MTEYNQMNQGGYNVGDSIHTGVSVEHNVQFNDFDQRGQSTNCRYETNFNHTGLKQGKKFGTFFKSTGGLVTAVTVALLVGFVIGTPQSIAHSNFAVKTSVTSEFDSWDDSEFLD